MPETVWPWQFHPEFQSFPSTAFRDRAILAMLLGCGLRRSELVQLDTDTIQTRQGHWAIVDLIGKGGHIRTVPVPLWAKQALDAWMVAAGITQGKIFRAVARTGKVWGKGISSNVVWYVVRRCCQRVGLDHIAPHDLRRTCARLCHTSGGEIEQIQFLLGHASVLTTERYLGCKQNLGQPVNDRFVLGSTQRSEASVENIGSPDRSLMMPEPKEPPVRNENFDLTEGFGEGLSYERTSELFPEQFVMPSQALAPPSSS